MNLLNEDALLDDMNTKYSEDIKDVEKIYAKPKLYRPKTLFADDFPTKIAINYLKFKLKIKNV